MFYIKEIHDIQLKQSIVFETLKDLPDWFGIDTYTQEYIDKAKTLTVYGAYTKNQAIGFIMLTETSKETLEIYCMGVKKKYHRNGVGNKLVNTVLESYQNKYHFIQVKTVAEGHYKEYNQSIKFYKSLGFKELEIFPTLWDEHNPCLILIKAL